MRRLSCRATGRDCEWEFIGDSDDEVIERAVAHDVKFHGFRPSPDDETQLRELIHD